MRNRLLHMMQIAGGTFPSGGFSQSWGLETYVYRGVVKDAESFFEFLQVYLEAGIGRSEGPVMARAWELAEPFEPQQIRDLNAVSNALKATAETRAAGIRMGKAFFRVMEGVLEDERMQQVKSLTRGIELSYPVIYGVVARIMGIDLQAAMEGYVFNAANGLVQSAVKLIPLGNTEAQRILYQASESLMHVVELSLEVPVEDVSNFCPGLDIASIEHETLPVRLYMS